jgi:DNA-binding phage protein
VSQTKEINREQVIAGVDMLCDYQFAVIDAMNARNISHAELAEQSGVRLHVVKNMLSSDAIVDLDTVGRVLRALGLRVRYERIPAEVA